MLLDRVIEWSKSDAARPKKYRLGFGFPVQYSKTDSSRLSMVATTIDSSYHLALQKHDQYCSAKSNGRI